jgi:energy-coupling factor transporter ATP-binding protein EcfA2
VLGDLQQQIELSTGCPGLVIYGRRRVGKSTLLRNLQGFLPESVVPVQCSMQSAEAFTSLGYFVETLCSEITSALGDKPKVAASESALVTLSRLLVSCNSCLAGNDQRLLLAIDEYENIDKKIGEKVFSADLLATIRESIQGHRRIIWAFCGSHHITELQHAEWTSYLISARSLEVPMFTPQETRLLLTDPMRYSSLWAGKEEQRPRYETGLWGENGIERIHEQAGGWPVLVQLIAETAIDLINDENKTCIDSELFERTLDRAIERGEIVLYELLRRESVLPGEWESLTGFRRQETQPPPEDEGIFQSLRRRLLVSEENGEWRLRVPLMARWLRARG